MAARNLPTHCWLQAARRRSPPNTCTYPDHPIQRTK
jgi:hypothetical protein